VNSDFRTGLAAVGPLLLLAGLGLGACGEKPQQVPTHTLYGTVTSSTVVANQRLAWIKLVGEDGDIDEPPLYSSSCLMQGPSCDYSMLFIAEGNYTAFAFIDMDGNAEQSELLPEAGDLVSGARPLFLLEKTRLDFLDQGWRTMP